MKDIVTMSHGKLDKSVATLNEDSWRTGRKRIMISNNKFSLGIDKKNVRLVIQYALPPDLDDYIQASGRAGRDGKAARCILLYRYNDIFSAMRTTDQTATRREKSRNEDSRKLLLSYCLDSETCRHSLMQKALHSGLDKAMQAVNNIRERSSCKCDNCEQSRLTVDLTKLVEKMLTKITDVNLTGIFWQSYDLFQHWSEGIEEMENVSDDEKNQIREAFNSVILCLRSLDILSSNAFKYLV